MNQTTAVTFRQVRNVSGFSRPMSVFDGFIYNVLTMGVIFPWTYLWGPASFPGANLELAILLTLIAQIPISLSYCFLATVLPVTGGDYVYQTRAFGKWGFVSVMSGFVIWILQWVALSGWLFATLGLAPLLLSIGVFTHSPTVTRWGVLVQSPAGVFGVSVILALITTVFLTKGLRLYVRVQKVLFYLTVAAILTVIYIFAVDRYSISSRLNEFVSALAMQTGNIVPSTLAKDFVGNLQAEVSNTGFNIAPSFSFWATLGVVPIAWTSLQWATYSVEQNTEIAEADRFGKQLWMLLFSAVVVAGALIALAYFERTAVSNHFLLAASAAYWGQKASPETVGFLKSVLQPFPNILAMAASKSVILVIIIALGFLANAFQITCNCFIGVTRILVQMGIDRVLPQKLGLEKVDPAHHAPVRAHWFYFLCSLPVIAGYSFSSSWATYTLGVTFACGYVFVLSTLAAASIPTRMSELWKSSSIHHFSPRLIKTCSYLGFSIGGAMVVAYLAVPQLGLTGNTPYLIVFGIILFSYILYIYAKSKSSLVEKALEQAPSEIEPFYK